MRISGPVVTVRHQGTGKTRRLHRSKVRRVDPNIAWDDARPKPPRVLRPYIQRPAPERDRLQLPRIEPAQAGTDPIRLVPAYISNNDNRLSQTRSRKRGREPEDDTVCKRNRQEVNPTISSGGRPLRLSYRARAAVDDHCPMDVDPIVEHNRKRKRDSTDAPPPDLQKIARWEAVALVSKL